jgi:hypothetical protein
MRAFLTTFICSFVFVHGLTGNRTTTWTSQSGVCWPRDLLSKEFPMARIMTFGYDADVVRLWNIAGSNTLRDHGNSLAHALANHRTTCSDRPVVYISHSLGGLVCEQALLCCRISNDLALKSLLAATLGVVFMGTPHSGSHLTTWGNTVARYLNIVRRVNRDVLSTLDPASQVLASVEQDFQQMLLAPKMQIKIFCFYEEKAINLVGKVVPDHSAILEQYPNASISENHMDMTKFSGRSDAGYQAVAGQLKRWISEESKRGTNETPSNSGLKEGDGGRIVQGNIDVGGGQVFFGDNVHRGTGDMNFGMRPN